MFHGLRLPYTANLLGKLFCREIFHPLSVSYILAMFKTTVSWLRVISAGPLPKEPSISAREIREGEKNLFSNEIRGWEPALRRKMVP